MTLQMCCQAAIDFWRGNRYGLKEYVIKDGKKHPFAVICPGGGYEMVCSFVEGVPYAKRLNELGYSAFIVYYRCKGKAKYPAPQDDLARAVKDIFSRAKELNLDTENYSVWGSSAGGHLVASFGTKHMGYEKYSLPKPSALILSYPVVTMEHYTHEGSRKNLLGEKPTAERIHFASVEKHIDVDYPSTFVWCEENDNVVDSKNSKELAKALENANVNYQLEIYSGEKHGLGLAQGTICEEWFDKAIRFWEKQRGKYESN